MKKPSLNLVVLRSADIHKTAAFYSLIGLEFVKHRHGTGLEHLSAEMDGCTFELYPISEDSKLTLGTRIGFYVHRLDDILSELSGNPGVVISPVKDSPWGRRAVIVDPDGHKVELLEQTAQANGGHSP
jgi:lactoylglutathione lyase